MAADPEPAANVEARAGRFRAGMAALPDWSDTLVVTHWGFIMALTGLCVPNGTWMRYDPTGPAPAEIPGGCKERDRLPPRGQGHRIWRDHLSRSRERSTRVASG